MFTSVTIFLIFKLFLESLNAPPNFKHFTMENFKHTNTKKIIYYNKPSHTYYKAYYTIVYLLHNYQHFPNLNYSIPLPFFF